MMVPARCGMLLSRVVLATLVSCVVLTGCGSQPSGPHLGQQLPGRTPQLFAPGVIRGGVHATAVFSPDGDDVYWSLWSDQGAQSTMHSHRGADGKWTAPAEAGFSRDGGAGNPCFTADGSAMFFSSKRQSSIPDDPTLENIWQADRAGTGWTQPRMLPEAVNALDVHWLFSLADSGDLYFGAGGVRGAVRDIYRARLVAGEYTDVTKLGPEINTDQYEDCPFIARDGSYLIFARVVNAARTNADLLISFRNADGSWREAVSMGSTINSSALEISPWVTYDGKYLFFVSNQNGQARVFWVSAGIIEELRREAQGG